jgi:hypothetical protein
MFVSYVRDTADAGPERGPQWMTPISFNSLIWRANYQFLPSSLRFRRGRETASKILDLLIDFASASAQMAEKNVFPVLFPVLRERPRPVPEAPPGIARFPTWESPY